MKKIKFSLSKQLTIITLSSLLLMILLLSFFLPKALEPYFEDTVYSYLSKPLEIMGKNRENVDISNIVVIQNMDNNPMLSPNYKDIIDIEEVDEILPFLNMEHGKFTYKNKTYYYSVKRNREQMKNATIIDDSYIRNLRKNMLFITIPVVTLIFLIILVLLLLWSNHLVNKIERLKLKIDNFNNKDFKISDNKNSIDDEMKVLDNTIDEMKEMILTKEQYEREMYQNISHDFKTPIMVVKSYVEAYKDKIETADNVINITEEEMNKLEKKVKTLLELNKVTYLKTNYENIDSINIEPILKDRIKKYKVINKDLDYELKINSKSKVNGSNEIWESIIDNILNNSIRYAKEKIVITVNKDNIIFYNDGDNIKDNMLKKIFDSYVKGSKGEHGLGLSIVKKNVELIGYKVYARNLEKGVEFIIDKE